MRNLTECQAEVFRRSEQRIKERKKRRKQVMMTCIPLVLCVCLYAALQRIPERSSPNPTEPLTEDIQASVSCSIARIDVQGTEISRSFTEVSDLLKISGQLLLCSRTDQEMNSPVPEATRGLEVTENGDDKNGEVLYGVPAGITITVVMRDGTSTEYHLLDNTLKNRTTDRTFLLTQNQMKELRELLGIQTAVT